MGRNKAAAERSKLQRLLPWPPRPRRRPQREPSHIQDANNTVDRPPSHHANQGLSNRGLATQDRPSRDGRATALS